MSTFVSVGNSKQSFHRLLVQIPKIQEILPKPIIIQKGVTSFSSNTFEVYDFLDNKFFQKTIKNSKLVITHAGAGTMLNAINAGKLPLVVPRLKKYNEIIDDHQIEIAQCLEEKGKVILVMDPKFLKVSIKKWQYFEEKFKYKKESSTNQLEKYLLRVFENENNKYQN